jgi:hypothetical protein
MLQNLNGLNDILFLYIKDAQVIEYGIPNEKNDIIFFDNDDKQVRIIKKDYVEQKGSIKPFKSYMSDDRKMVWKFSDTEFKYSDRTTRIFKELYLDKKAQPKDPIFLTIRKWVEKIGREVGTLNVLNNINDKKEKFIIMQLFTPEMPPIEEEE